MLDQLICTRRQVNFQIHKECNIKIGLNTTANKFYPLNNRIGLCMLNMSFVPFKRAAKVLFLKYGKTWIIYVEILYLKLKIHYCTWKLPGGLKIMGNFPSLRALLRKGVGWSAIMYSFNRITNQLCILWSWHLKLVSYKKYM